MSDNKWTDELKAKVVEDYLEAEPNQENSMQIVKDLAEQYEKTPNGVRIILSRANVYVKTSPAVSSSTEKKESTSKRINKNEAINTLKSKIKDLNQSVDDDIIDRMTGKAANYFFEVLTSVG